MEKESIIRLFQDLSALSISLGTPGKSELGILLGIRGFFLASRAPVAKPGLVGI